MNIETRRSFVVIGLTLSTIFGLIVVVGLIAHYDIHDNMFYYAVFGLCLGIILIMIPLLIPIKYEEPTKDRDALR